MKPEKKIQKKVTAVPLSSPPLLSIFPWTFQVKCIILALVCFIFYANTLKNQYAFDDRIILVHNDFVQDGLKGLMKILTSDSYQSYYEQMSAGQQLAGGRYRPLSQVVFWLEHTLFGDSPGVYHFVNILFYALLVIAIYYFLTNFFFKKVTRGDDISFLATVIFTIHPIHTEVVANLKSLDEILSLLFTVGTFIFSLTYLEKKKKKYLWYGLICYFLSLLSKEYGLMLVILLPALIVLLTNRKPFEAFTLCFPYYGIVFVYFLLRFNAVGMGGGAHSGDILNNPYLFATPVQRVATEIFVLGKYIYMLFIPYPLSCDYSYNTIPYHGFSSITFWLSLLAYIGITWFGFTLLRKKNILAFPIFFYLSNIFLVSNFLMDIGATMGERFTFESSLGFVMLLSYGIIIITKKLSLPLKKGIITGFLSLLVLVCAAEVISRNADWENDTVLFTHDVYVSPNSAMLNSNGGRSYIEIAERPGNEKRMNSLLDTAMPMLKKSIALHKRYTNSYIILGVAYYHLGMPDSAKAYWDVAQSLYPDHPFLKEDYHKLALLYLQKGKDAGVEGKPMEAVRLMQKGIPLEPENPDLWYNLGGAYFSEERWDSARYCWKVALQLKPGYPEAIKGLDAIPK